MGDRGRDSTYWSYGYNDRGEVTSGKKSWSDATPAAGQQFEYDFDNIGNRNWAKAGGDATGANLRLGTYTASSLNQYSQRTVPGGFDVFGTANSLATVAVNNQAPYRRNDYFRLELPLSNVAAPVYGQVNVIGSRDTTVTQQSGYVFLPQTPEGFTYDLDGNLTSDGQWTYTWDAENRLIRMESIGSVPPEAKQKLEFAYDFQGRRIEKKVWVWRAALSSYLLQSATRFVYDRWNLVAELNGPGTAIRSYVWGQDMSGTLDGAGGIGGLLFMREGTNTYQVGYDGNGNVAALVKASTGTVSASYDYDPFGNTLKATGEAASRNAFAFATKYTDPESGFLDYGLRFYNPSAGRWISRDPIEEAGGLNLYAFTRNNPVNTFDLFGLVTKDVKVVVKSFIQKIGPVVGRPPAGTLQGHPGPDAARMAAWIALWEVTNALFDENPGHDAKDRVYRMYSERTFRVCVVNGRIERVDLKPEDSVKTDVGVEVVFAPEPMTIWGVKAEKSSDSTYVFAWSGKSKPNDNAEPAFQAVAPRTSKYIWHSVSGEIAAVGEDVKVRVRLQGSRFPAHRAWLNDEPAANQGQGEYRELWKPHPEDPTRAN